MSQPALKIVIAGGGTGGHVLPAVATLQALRRLTAVEPLWIGSRAGYERSVAEREGIPYRAIPTGKLRRYFSLQTPIDAVRVPLGVLVAWRLLGEFRPDVVFATGGFVSVPTVVAARARGVPSLSHEQTATIGLATRINAHFCDVLALSHEASRARLGPTQAKVIVTGNPVRASILQGRAEEAYRAFGFQPEMPLVYVTGGALGAHAINEAVREALPRLLQGAQILHQCGPAAGNGDLPRLEAARAALPPDLQRRYVVRELLGPELPDVYAATALVVGRAGAGTVAELAALGKPSVLIPLPGAGGDEQTLNARTLADAGAAVLLPQRELTPERLVAEVQRLLGDRDRLAAMGERARASGHLDAADRLARALLALAEGRRTRVA